MLSPELIELIPYMVAVIALFISGENSDAPKAMTVPYLKNKYKLSREGLFDKSRFKNSPGYQGMKPVDTCFCGLS